MYVVQYALRKIIKKKIIAVKSQRDSNSHTKNDCGFAGKHLKGGLRPVGPKNRQFSVNLLHQNGPTN